MVPMQEMFRGYGVAALAAGNPARGVAAGGRVCYAFVPPVGEGSGRLEMALAPTAGNGFDLAAIGEVVRRPPDPCTPRADRRQSA